MTIGVPTKIYRLLTPPERLAAVVLVVLVTIAALLETLGIGLVIPAIVVLTQPDPAATYPAMRPVLHLLGYPTRQQLIVEGLVLLLTVYLVKTLFCASVIWRQMRFTFDLQARIAERLFASYLRQPYTFHLQRNSAQLIRNLVTEVREFANCGILPMILLVTESTVLLGVAILLLTVQPVGAIVVVIVVGAFSGAFYATVRTRVSGWGEARQHHDGFKIQHLQQGLSAVKDVILLGREADFLRQHEVHNRASARAAHRVLALIEMPRLGLEFLGVFSLTVLVLAMLLQGEDTSTIVPTLGLFAAAAFRLMPSLNRVISAVQLLRYGAASVDVLSDEMALDVQTAVSRGGVPHALANRIEMVNVTYTYPKAAAPSLKNVSLTIERGELVGLVGPSGSGKSTLADILLGLLKPDSGTVLVDGLDTHADLRAWQDRIGYVPQTIYLTDDTLRRNVGFGLADADIDDGAVARAIAAAQLEEFVAERPDGVHAVLGERGVRLSGGQRQRLGIARALYHDPDVLVLDEATSALDTETEQGVMHAVEALHGRKTVLIVAHRLTTVERCDRLYRLDEGRIVQQGTPADVLLGAGPRTRSAAAGA